MSEADNRCEGLSARVVSRWLWPGNRTFLDVASMVVSWWIVAFLSSVKQDNTEVTVAHSILEILPLQCFEIGCTIEMDS